MEKYSLIDLLEEDDENEDDKQETSQQRKRHHLAVSILNFVANRSVIEDNDIDDKEEDVLSLLFDQSPKAVGDQIETMSETIDPIVLATQVVENRIEELSQEVDVDSTDESMHDDNLEKIQALEEVVEYLNDDDRHTVEFNQTSPLAANEEPTKIPTNAEIIETDHKIISDEEAIKKSSSKTKKKNPSSQKTINDYKLERQESNQQTKDKFESTINTENNPINNLAPESIRPVNTVDRTESLVHTRELIDNLYVQDEKMPEPRMEKILPKKPEAILTAKPELTTFERPKSIAIEIPKPIPKYNYLDIAKRITVDNMSLNQFFNKNNFDQKSRIRIITDILRGEKPAKVIEKEMRKRGKFKKLINSYSEANLVDQPLSNAQTKESSTIEPNELVVDKTNFIQSSINAKIWALIIVIIILLIAIFIVLKLIIG